MQKCRNEKLKNRKIILEIKQKDMQVIFVIPYNRYTYNNINWLRMFRIITMTLLKISQIFLKINKLFNFLFLCL